MQVLKKSSDIIILRLDSKEEVRRSVENFCAEQNIQSGWIEVLGSTQDVELAYYDIKKKEYLSKRFHEDLEILTITGNIALKDGKPFCHAHGTFSNKAMQVVGGHINLCVVSATGEVMIRVTEGLMKREFDEKTGLFLLQ